MKFFDAILRKSSSVMSSLICIILKILSANIVLKAAGDNS